MKSSPDSKDAPTHIVKNVGDLIIEYFKLEGVTHVFGIPGGGLMHLLEQLKDERHDIHYVICRQETGAAYMADGYYRATGKLGVVAVTSGPGATNALTGVMNAQADGSAVMLITGEIGQKFYGMGYLQEGVDNLLNIDDVFRAATSYSNMIDSGSSADTLLRQALRNALSVPRQAVHLSLPVNVAMDTLPDNLNIPASSKAFRTQFKGAPMDEVEKAMESLLACKRPLLFLGNGCRDVLRDPQTYDNLLRFVEEYAIPVITTADAKGIFSEAHEMSLRVFGIADCIWPYYYMQDLKDKGEVPYDGLMVIGSQLGELSTNKWSDILLPAGSKAPFIQVDANQKIIARSYLVTHGIVGEAGAFINDLATLIPKYPKNAKVVDERRKVIQNITNTYSPFISQKDYDSNENPIQPASLMRVLQDSMPANTKIFIDAGNCVGWSVHYLKITPPASIFTSLSMGPMGFAVGAVVGAKHGCPNDTCIAFVGDGAFMMQGSEISTAKQNKVGAIWIVLSDNDLSMVSQGMEILSKPKTTIWSKLYALGEPDLVKYSEGLGADAYTVNAPDDFTKIMPTVLKRANDDQVPQVVVVNINKEAVPPYYNPMYPPKK